MVMEFHFNVNELLPQTVTRTVGAKVPPCRQLTADGTREKMATVVNEMGLASAKAQGLRSPITSYQKLATSNQTLYIMKEGSSNNGKGVIVGILKTGQKNLFLSDPCGVQHKVSPLCVLDFYVHESKQRCGYGKALFEAMLEAENLKPFEIAIDRPSPKFLGFLRKHYKLQSYIRQANNYVVFDQFFTTCTDVCQKSRRSLQSKNEAILTSPSNVIKSPPSIPQNTSLQKLTDSTRAPKAEEIKGVHNDCSVISPITTTESAKGTISTQSTCIATNAPVAADYGKSPHTVAGDLTSSLLTRGLTKHHQPRRQRFNIITGHPLQQESDSALTLESSPSQSFTSSLNKIDSTNDLNSSKSSCTAGVGVEASIERLQKAPHLNMRQTGRNKFQKNSSFSGMSTYRASFKPIPGFYSTSTTSVVSAGSIPSASAAMNYSRHSVPHNLKMCKSAPHISNFGGSDSSQLGLQWTSSTSRNMSTNKLKDNWKSFIL